MRATDRALRERRFAEAYYASRNAGQAARAAGSRATKNESLAVFGRKMLLRATVQEHLARLGLEGGLTNERALEIVGAAAVGSPASFLSEVEGGWTLDLRKAAEDGALGLIREIETTDTVDGPRTKVKIADRLRAAEIFLKARGVLEDQQRGGAAGPGRGGGGLGIDLNDDNAIAAALRECEIPLPPGLAAALEAAEQRRQASGAREDR